MKLPNQLMIELKNQKWKFKLNDFRLLPYIAVGNLIFYFNSTTDVNYIFKGYSVLLEVQVTILLLLFLTGKLGKHKRRSS